MFFKKKDHKCCFHEVEGSHRKLPVHTNCKHEKPEYVVWGFTCEKAFAYVKVKYTKKCCICGLKKEVTGWELGIDKALSYPKWEGK